MVIGGPARTRLKIIAQTFFSDFMEKNGLGEGRAADIPQANKKNVHRQKFSQNTVTQTSFTAYTPA
jgi:hypothetical protein